MRIGHWQLESKTGDFETNLGKVVKGMERADKERVEVVSFPECFLTGYPDKEEVVRRSAFAVDSPQMRTLLDKTSRFEATYIVGFNEVRGPDLYNTAVVVQKGHILGTYSKCFAYMKFHKQGREFPVFERSGVKFGVIICADGGYIEPTRILALKGARIIFAPHFNYIGTQRLIYHFQKVRSDHVARAVENQVFFVRGNNVVLGKPDGFGPADGQGYGDSYVLDPNGEIVVRGQRMKEDFIFADVDPVAFDDPWGRGRSLTSIRALSQHLLAAAAAAGP
ncbi:MAG: carbon-nitrogen hydrolase family protein [Gemmataceae bacterium]